MKPISCLDWVGLRRTEKDSESEETRQPRVDEAADESGRGSPFKYGVIWITSNGRVHITRGESSPRYIRPPES